MQYISSGTDCGIHDYRPGNHCTVRFRLSSPFDGREMSGSLPTASAGVQFRKTQQVYQNLCCLFFVALSFQKPDLVPDLIPPGGALPGPVLLQHLVDFSCFWMSVINMVKELSVLRRSSLAFTGSDEMHCYRLFKATTWDLPNSFCGMEGRSM